MSDENSNLTSFTPKSTIASSSAPGTLTSQLPKGWVWTRLGEIAGINPRFNDELPDNMEVSFLPMKCVEELSGRIDLSLTRRLSEVKKGYTAFKDGDIFLQK